MEMSKSLLNFTVDYSVLHADDGFIYPFLYNIEKQKNNGPTWAYRFEYKGEICRTDPITGICEDGVAAHASHINSYFNMRSRHPSVSPIETPADKAVSKRLIKYLVNFAYYDNPTPPGSNFIWEQYKGNDIMRLTKKGDFMADADYVSKLKTVLDLWSNVIGWE
ncbi:hypothetical protein GE061_008333 [Apolygus lucorum]|uniref:Carboxylesterase type B domain-containing protein n=1 Tax=Apolygus lucorum TaxID=248454 RepID=A0A8S9WT59_APOLU|nr:hypothetical protein GE061_008333 [Apolygus lucorum]